MGRLPSIPVEKKTRIVLIVLAGEVTIAEAARRETVTEQSIGRAATVANWPSCKPCVWILPWSQISATVEATGCTGVDSGSEVHGSDLHVDGYCRRSSGDAREYDAEGGCRG